MRQSLLICAAMILVSTLGCQSRETKSPTAPEIQNLNYHGSISLDGPRNSDGTKLVPPGFPATGTWIQNPDNPREWGYVLQAIKGIPNLQTAKVIYEGAKIVAICDYPLDFVGPLPYGHCYTNGEGCSL